MRTISLHPASMLLGIALGITILLSMSQVSSASGSWGPPKKSIINVFHYDPGSPVTVPAGGSFTVYTVPGDRWLTVTGIMATSNLGSNGRWAEDHSGVVTEKGLALSSGAGPMLTPENSGGAVGWTFSPGSKVVFLNIGASGTADLNSYGLIEYLSRD